MKHVRVVIDEIVWFDGIPEELNIFHTDDTLVLKLGPKQQRRGGSLGELLKTNRETPPPRPLGEYVPPLNSGGGGGGTSS
jgi:hypothetical protein